MQSALQVIGTASALIIAYSAYNYLMASAAERREMAAMAATGASGDAATAAKIAEATAAHLEAKKALAHAEANERDGKMPKRMVASIRRREAAAKEALHAAIAGNSAAAEEAPKKKKKAAASVGQEWLASSPKWAVVGDVLNSSKPAASVVSALKDVGKTVHLVNPRDKTKKCFASLSDIGQPIDVVNLCINSVTGLKIAEQAAALGECLRIPTCTPCLP